VPHYELHGAKNGKLGNVNQKHFESFEMWCWRRMVKLSWTDHVKNVEVLHRKREFRNRHNKNKAG
jgi:hypothetical protein